MSKRRTYSKQFKLDAIQQSYQRDNIHELADELGINPGRNLLLANRATLSVNWLDEYPNCVDCSLFIRGTLVGLIVAMNRYQSTGVLFLMHSTG